MGEALKKTSSEKEMSLIDHLGELRRRLLYTLVFFVVAFGFSYVYSQEIFGFLVHPLAKILEGETGRRLIYTGLAEAFLSYLKVSLFMAAFLSLPVLATQVWLFIAPGLYAQEKKAFFPFLMATPLLFLLGAGFAYYGIIPPAWKFFLYFESAGGEGALPIQLEARVGEYLSIVMQLVLAFGVCFQLPVLLSLLAWVRLIRAETLKKKRKYAFIFILIVSAFLTPPDVLSMIGLAIPLYLLYEISVLLVHFIEKKRNVEN